MSIELSAIDPAWRGALHLVTPLEPDAGYVGEDTSDAHNAFTRENWLAFRREPDGHYRFLGERDYFLLERPAPDVDSADIRAYQAARQADLEAHYAVQRASFEASKARYATYGMLTYADSADPLKRNNWGEGAILDQLGGVTGFGNWTDCPEIPAAFRMDTEDMENVFPRLGDGRPFRFIASVAGYPWQDTGADAILLFYEPETRTVLLTFDWT